MAHPTTTHWNVVKRILCYLKSTSSHGISLHASLSFELQGYTNADWASSPDDRHSTGGYYIFLGPNLISWSSTKQKVVSRSSAESEYQALVSITAEITWVQALLKELCISQTTVPLLWCDNQSVAALAANPISHARSKHVELDLHFIRDKVLRQEIQIQYISSTYQVADIITKHLPSSQFITLRTKLSMVPRPVSLRGDVEPQNSLKTNYQTPPENFSSAPDNSPVCYYVMA